MVLTFEAAERKAMPRHITPEGYVGARQQPTRLGVLGIDLQHVLELDDRGAHVALVAVVQCAVQVALELLAAVVAGRQADCRRHDERDAHTFESRGDHGNEVPAGHVATILVDGGVSGTSDPRPFLEGGQGSYTRDGQLIRKVVLPASSIRRMAGESSSVISKVARVRP